MKLNVNGIDVELSEDGVSSNGRGRLKADRISIPGVGEAFIKVYLAAPAVEKTAKPVAPKVRKANGTQEAPVNPALAALANLSPEQQAKLEKVLAALSAKAS